MIKEYYNYPHVSIPIARHAIDGKEPIIIDYHKLDKWNIVIFYTISIM